MVNSGYNKYKNNSIMTASHQELVLMLYNGAIKFCNQAIESLEYNKLEIVNNYLHKVQDIIDEFRITLDKQYPIAEDMDKLYEYMNWRLMQANVYKDKKMIEEARDMLRELRDTWKEAMTLSKSKKGNKPASGE
ncbi:MAG: flagellar export chaperone FliS [Eubacteriales bacterium]